MVNKSLFLKRIIRQYLMRLEIELCMKDALKMSNCDAEVVEARSAKIYLHAMSWTKGNVTGSTRGAAK
jgi:hypothetical protein